MMKMYPIRHGDFPLSAVLVYWRLILLKRLGETNRRLRALSNRRPNPTASLDPAGVLAADSADGSHGEFGQLGGSGGRSIV